MHGIIFLLIYAYAVILAVQPRVFPQSLFRVSWFFVAVLVSFSLRENLTGDIVNYVASIPNVKFSEYYSREFMFWYPAKLISIVFTHPLAPIYALDIITFIFFYFGLNSILNRDIDKTNIPDNNFIFFCVLIYAPLIMGYTNYYRQIIASAIALCSIGFIIQNKHIKSGIFFSVAAFTHNPVLLFLPFLMKFNLKILMWFGLLSSLILSLFLLFIKIFDVSIFFFLRDSGASIGATIHLGYFFILCFTSLVIFGTWQYCRDAESRVIFLFQATATMIYLLLMFFVESGYLQRIFIYIIMIMFPFYYRIYLKIVGANNSIVRLSFLHIIIFPLILIWPTAIYFN